MAKLKKGDMVVVLSGKDRGKRGKILRVLPDHQAAIVERLNLAKHFERRTRADRPGGVIERESPIALDKVALVCPRCNRPARVGWSVSQDGTKLRLCKRCREVIHD